MATTSKKRPKRSLMLVHSLTSLGILLILIGVSWKQLVPTSTFWDSQDAAALAELQAAAHAESIGHKDSFQSYAKGPQQHPTEYPTSARTLYESKQSELDRAKRTHDRWGYCFTGVGALVAFAGMLIGRSFI